MRHNICPPICLKLLNSFFIELADCPTIGTDWNDPKSQNSICHVIRVFPKARYLAQFSICVILLAIAERIAKYNNVGRTYARTKSWADHLVCNSCIQIWKWCLRFLRVITKHTGCECSCTVDTRVSTYVTRLRVRHTSDVPCLMQIHTLQHHSTSTYTRTQPKSGGQHTQSRAAWQCC